MKGIKITTAVALRKVGNKDGVFMIFFPTSWEGECYMGLLEKV